MKDRAVADPRAFISFDFDNNLREKNLFVGQIKNSTTPFDAEDWSSNETLPQKQWEKLIKDKVNACHLMIVLVGKKTHVATGVKKEIKFAGDQDVPFFGVYVDGANTATTLPTGLTGGRLVKWDWDKISGAIDQVMKEGKNG